MLLSLKSSVLTALVLVALASHPVTDALSKDEFPPDFVFGASTSAYQVEGAADEDGRKPGIWDTFAHGNGNIHGGDGDIACDQYHKYKEDVQLMADMGLDAHRFSISWSRLIPDGRGPVNPKGLEYYNNLINELISHGIQPHVTLHHWDLPQTLEDEYGGWVSRRIVKDFTAYAEVCFREFGDRVKYWTTVNEANVFAIFGYGLGNLPPARCTPSVIANCSRGNSSTEPYLAAHYILLSHASAVRLYRKKYQGMQHGFIGFNLLTFGLVPLTNTSEDISATERARDFNVGWFLNPFTFGDYPDSMKKNAGSRLPSFTQKESDLVKGSMDFLGVNFYFSFYVKNSPEMLVLKNRNCLKDMAAELQFLGVSQDDPSKSLVPITTWSLHGALDKIKNIYGNIPIYIHENGQQTPRNSSLEIDDWPRVKYLQEYIGSMLDILRSGLNVKGYFVWSLLDAYELLSGYESSYGLYYIDLKDASLKRHPKLSAQWYSNFLNRRNIMDTKVTMEIEKNGVMLLDSPLMHNATRSRRKHDKILGVKL